MAWVERKKRRRPNQIRTLNNEGALKGQFIRVWGGGQAKGGEGSDDAQSFNGTQA
jgi:hypothetical protein